VVDSKPAGTDLIYVKDITISGSWMLLGQSRFVGQNRQVRLLEIR
jgi:hypothetical protein